MTPKAKLSVLLRNWSTRPKRQVRDIQSPFQWTPDKQALDIEQWVQSRKRDFLPVANLQSLELHKVLYLPTLDCGDEDALRLIQDGLDAASYWSSVGKPRQMIIPIRASWLDAERFLMALQNRFANYHLALGLIHMSIFNVQPDANQSLAHALLKIKRLGITIGIHYQGNQEKLAELVHKQLIQFIDVDITRLIDGLTHLEALEQVLTLKNICETSHIDCIVSGIEFINQRNLCVQAGLAWGYGNLIASPLDVGKIAQMHKMSISWKDVHRWS